MEHPALNTARYVPESKKETRIWAEVSFDSPWVIKAILNSTPHNAAPDKWCWAEFSSVTLLRLCSGGRHQGTRGVVVMGWESEPGTYNTCARSLAHFLFGIITWWQKFLFYISTYIPWYMYKTCIGTGIHLKISLFWSCHFLIFFYQTCLHLYKYTCI